jgi:putative transcriptional regulator
MVETRIEEVLEERGRTFYWLAKETGISHTTLWRLKKGKALGINFVTLEGICRALECQPGDVLRLTDGGRAGAGKSAGKKKRANGKAAAVSPAKRPTRRSRPAPR